MEIFVGLPSLLTMQQSRTGFISHSAYLHSRYETLLGFCVACDERVLRT